MKKRNASVLSAVLMLTMVISVIFSTNGLATMVSAAENTTDHATETEPYTIYPAPHELNYHDERFNVSDTVNMVYESQVDTYTKKRVEEMLEAKNIKFTEAKEIDPDATNFLVGIYESNEYVDQYFKDQQLTDEDTLSELDANIVSIKENVIGILGKDVDSAFYGVTTLKHIFKQMQDRQIEALTIHDYADVKGRGFIEGYYGEPWSTEDRADLMTFGGDFKMNSYIYAPKDDPKHNGKWKELYNKEELQDISKLAEAGNASKTRFVYTLHPFMNEAMRFNTEENYQADLDIIKEKFTQLLDAGVRKFGILGDDAGVPGEDANNYVTLMTDLTDWLKEQENEYDGLVTDMIFTPNDYMGWGDSSQIQSLRDLPESVSLVQTGGKVWGEVSNDFTQTFTDNAGTPPYLWINWPVTDNSKQHLIMGGGEKFLHPGVDPANIEGIVLNPMQQSEPSKAAIFANADYSWNVWDNEDQAKKNWDDTFAYMDHLNINETPASNALRELSKHMINQDMDSRVVKLEESVELAPKINKFKNALGKEAITDKAQVLIEEFKTIREAAQTYKDEPGNERMSEQMKYWLNSALDTADAAIYLLKAEMADEQDEKSAVWENYSQGQAAFEASKDHPFSYIDHKEFAEVGVQHIVPFIKTLLNDVSDKVASIIDPDFNAASFITNRTDTPTGDVKNILDNNPNTDAIFKKPNAIKTGTYVGIQYDKPITVNKARFELGRVGNDEDTFNASKAQYTVDGETWKDIEGSEYGHVNQVVIDDLDLKVKGIRLIATKDRQGTWLGIKDIVINEEKAHGKEQQELIVSDHFSIYEGEEANLFDGDDSSYIWYDPSGTQKDTSVAGDYIGVDLKKVKDLGTVSFSVGRDNADKWTHYQLEYSTDNKAYTTYKEYNGKASGMDKIEEDLTGIEARYVRLKNLKDVPVWIKFSGIDIETKEATSEFTYTNTDDYKSIPSQQSKAETSLSKTTDITLKPQEYLGVKLERIKELDNVKVSETSGKLSLQVSMNEVEWAKPAEGNNARYVRLLNDTDEAISFDLNTFNVFSKEIQGPEFVETSLEIHPDYADKDSRNNDTLLNVFDKDLATKSVFTDYQKEGESITYSVGEPRIFNSLRIYNEENSINYIRDAKVQLSMDNEEWTDVATIGDGEDNLVGGKKDYADMIKDGYKHDSDNPGNYYFGNDDIEGIEAQYIRIVFTADYSARFAHINEIFINDGDYVQTKNDPTFEADPIEVDGYGPDKMIDGDLTTAFKPNMTDQTEGSLTYRLSEDTDATTITIVQDANTISNATVSARVSQDKWVELGVLDESLNTLNNSTYDHIFEIRLTWGDVQPVIYEMNISNTHDLDPVSDISDLQALVEEYEASDDFSSDQSVRALNLHLKSLAHFEASDSDEKVIKHLKGFKNLLDHQKEEEQISVEAHEALINGANTMIDSLE